MSICVVNKIKEGIYMLGQLEYDKEIISSDRKMSTKESVWFIVYCYVVLALRNMQAIASRGESYRYDEDYKYRELFLDYKISKTQVKEYLLQLFSMNRNIISLGADELESLIEMTHYFFNSSEFIEELPEKIDDEYVQNITKDIMLDMFQYGKYPINSNYPFWADYRAIFKST